MNGIDRYYKRESLNLDCTVITPMFLGNARQEAEWRAAPFKSLLRYWWRITQHNVSDHVEMNKKESELFGAASEKDGKSSGKSLFYVQINSNDKICDADMRQQTPIFHPELKSNRNPDGKVNPILYLAGIGLMRSIKNEIKVTYSYFPSGASFEWKIGYPKDMETIVQQILILINAFGTIGGRSRNGWGSFRIKDKLSLDIKAQSNILREKHTIDWKTGFEKDYPNCLGKDGENLLLWKTKQVHESWEDSMRELADVYVGVRVREVNGIEKLDPGGDGTLKERHLLGLPLTRHNVTYLERHASPLRFIVKQRGSGNKYEGFVLHLPFLFSADNNMDWQISVWNKVHKKLDFLLTRVTDYEEIL